MKKYTTNVCKVSIKKKKFHKKLIITGKMSGFGALKKIPSLAKKYGEK